MIEPFREYLLMKKCRKRQPQLIIIDGVDGCGKTTITQKLIDALHLNEDNALRNLDEKNFEIVWNHFKRKCTKMNQVWEDFTWFILNESVQK